PPDPVPTVTVRAMKVASEAPARAAIPADGAATAEEGSTPRWLVVAAVFVVVVAIVMRFVTRSELWLDEALSVNIPRLPPGHIPDWLRHAGAPPLYHFLLHLSH